MKHLFLLLTLLSFSLTALAQQKVTGKVKDSSGEPVIGASVVVKGNNTMGTITDFDGNFMLDVPTKSVLVISYIGYVTQEVPTVEKKSLEIILKEDTKTLDEVVVIGYGTQRKGDVTSSVASVKADNFVKGAVKDVGQLIQGKVAGLAITNPNGDPTGSTQIRLRGTNTIGGANTAPLVLIDGIPGELGTVAPEDVESVDVLKDGSAAAIYGTRGTNGVILIIFTVLNRKSYRTFNRLSMRSFFDCQPSICRASSLLFFFIGKSVRSRDILLLHPLFEFLHVETQGTPTLDAGYQSLAG